MDKTIIYQLLTTGSLLCFLICEIASFLTQRKPLVSRGEILWNVKAVRTGSVKFGLRRFLLMAGLPKVNEMPLEEGTYLIGNDRGCDIYLDVSGRGRTRLFLDVRPECVYLTVMKGTVTIAGTQYHANPGSRMELQEYMRIRVGNADLILQKERWR